MQIWAHTLVQNEGRWLWFSVTSVIDHIDRMLLWDYGSSDNTREIIKALKAKYGDKIISSREPGLTAEEFPLARQKMLDATKADWVLMLDGDEMWWKDSIIKVVSEIRQNPNLESIVVPTYNLVGDIFHYQEEEAGRYHFLEKTGHFNLRAINTKIPGLRSEGIHGLWGWVDNEGKMIQDRSVDKLRFVDAPYLHASFLKRSSSNSGDYQVAKRAKKLKYEFGLEFPPDFYYPESLFSERPAYIESPWSKMNFNYRVRAIVETPLRKLNRKFLKNKVGY
jgi:glycosyltransferase involved in cell wall biosynthesis